LRKEENMTLLSMSEKGQTFKYVLLTTKIVQVLQRYEKKEPLSTIDKQILSRGGALLEKIIEGSILVEGKELIGFSPTLEGLSVYGYALSTIEALKFFNNAEGFTDFFKNLLTQLKKIKCEEKEIVENIGFLKKFFLLLGNAFRNDILKERYSAPIEEEYPTLKKHK